MWLCVTTSSPVAGVAVFDGLTVLVEASLDAPMRASGASMRLMQRLLSEQGLRPEDIAVFCADVGPGSFTGVRVGVTIAKTMAYALGKKTAAVSAFDLIDAPGGAAVAVPARRGSYLLREAGGILEAPDSDPRLSKAFGYGAAFSEQRFPRAGRAAEARTEAMEPAELLPRYILEPNISKPKRPYPERRA